MCTVRRFASCGQGFFFRLGYDSSQGGAVRAQLIYLDRPSTSPLGYNCEGCMFLALYALESGGRHTIQRCTSNPCRFLHHGWANNLRTIRIRNTPLRTFPGSKAAKIRHRKHAENVLHYDNYSSIIPFYKFRFRYKTRHLIIVLFFFCQMQN